MLIAHEVPHGGDIPFVFGQVAAMNESASVIVLSTVMIDYWVSFATSLDPNDGLGSPRPTWAPYTASDQVMHPAIFAGLKSLISSRRCYKLVQTT